MLMIGSLAFSQSSNSEYLTIRVQYISSVNGISNEVSVDIGQLEGHSLYGKVTNEDGEVVINGTNYASEIDLLNYFGSLGWKIFETKTQKILTQEFYCYLLIRF